MNRERNTLIGLLVFAAACGGGTTTPSADAGTDAAVTGCRSSAECDDGLFCDGEEACVDGECVLGAQVLCADSLDCTVDRCDEERRACVHQAPDEDGDGHATIDCGGDDCDDTDANRFPGNTEVCDADDHDEDCDPTTYGFRDADSDGWPDADCCNVDSAGARACGDDCDDSLPTAHPSEAESCDGVDNDCDGAIDEGVKTTYTIDVDGDRHGAPGGETREACFVPDGFAELADDCDDSDASVHPGAVEVCGSPAVDEDCDGVANPPDLCNCTTGESGSCGLPGVCESGSRDCIAGGWGACSIAGSAETCNGLDDDCDGTTDEGLVVTCFADTDNDGFASPGTPDTQVCPDPARAFVGGCPRDFTDRVPFGAAALDCDDVDGTRFPGATELCDGIDNDCDGAIDEALLIRCFVDADGDGFAASGSAGALTCPSIGGACPGGMTANDPVTTGADCDDTTATRSPALAEACNGVDDDCDGAIDEGVQVVCYTDADGDGFAAAGATMTSFCPNMGSFCPSGQTPTPPAAGATDCDDGTVLRSPAALEICNHIDTDCDGVVDEGVSLLGWYPDADGDTFGDSRAAASVASDDVCPGDVTPAWVRNDADCRDDDEQVYPGNTNSYAEPACPSGWTPCDVIVTGRPSYTLRGCGNGVSCVSGPRMGGSFWDYDCSGTVESSDPLSTGSCTPNPAVSVCELGPSGPEPCLGSGFAYSVGDFGGNVPCGQGQSWNNCYCRPTTTPFNCAQVTFAKVVTCH